MQESKVIGNEKGKFFIRNLKKMSVKKKVMLVDNTVNICNKLTKIGDIKYSASLNEMAQQYEIYVNENLPILTENEEKLFYCAFNGRLLHPDITQEINMLHINVSEAYQHDEQVRNLFEKSEVINFIERIKKWSQSQKLSVIYMSRAFFRKD